MTELEEIKKWIKSVDEKLNNHLTDVAKEMSRIANDVDWIKRFFWLVASIAVVAIMGAFFGLILK